ncbi:MAG: DsrE family protein [Candidatus Eremiobacteraeota bacterium]|nr:DsrE family protein [Candidatus Eremiobacteraeota bacterium]
MAKKNVALMLNHSPYTGSFCEEGLRVAVGTHMAIEGQSVKTICIGDGVYFGLASLKQGDFLKYIKIFQGMGMELFIEEDSLRDRNIARERLRDDAKVVTRSEILSILKDSEHVLSF